MRFFYSFGLYQILYLNSLKAFKIPFTRLPFALSCLCLLYACDADRVYEQNYDFANARWMVDTLPSFRFEITDPDEAYNIFWNVRNTIDYPYQNLYLTYYLEDTLGRTISTDLHNMLLFDPKTGKPYGSGMGDIFSHQITALPQHKFDSAGMYQVRLQQYMRTDTLQDILSVGVRVEVAVP